jgi:hypothetical protein
MGSCALPARGRDTRVPLDGTTLATYAIIERKGARTALPTRPPPVAAERPDIDATYMHALHSLGEQGGWPLTGPSRPRPQLLVWNPFCHIRVWSNWEGLYCAMVVYAFQADPYHQRHSLSKHWRRLEAEARVIALSMGDPESKRVMLHVAAGYKRLAERAELQNAKRYVDGASFGPEAVKAMGEAFDSAWNEIAGNIDEDHTETVRSNLANALLSVASEDSRNAPILKRAALQRFALDYWRI